MDISLDTGTGTLSGSLLQPSQTSIHPVVLLLAGSGPTDRDGNNPLLPVRNDCLKLVAEALRDHGLASVRYDKRGVAASAAAGLQESDLRVDTYAQDAAEWIKALKVDARFSSVGVVGHSEGSLIAMLAMELAPADAFVSVAAPAQNAAVLLRGQLREKLTPPLSGQSEMILAALENGEQSSSPPPELHALYRESVQPYLISWFKRTPTVELSKLSACTLIISGAADNQVGVEQATMLKRAKPDAELVLVSGMNHLLKLDEPEIAVSTARQQNAPEPLAPDFVRELVHFLQRSLEAI